MQVLLFELATEEIPAAYQKNLHADWQKRLPGLLKLTGLEHGEPSVYATARRIAFSVPVVNVAKENTEILTGPAKSAALTADGKPSPALIGFSKKAGVEPENIVFKDTGKGEYATATVTRQGKTLQESLPILLNDLIANYRFPRSMRWGNGEISYARPISGYFLKYGSVDFTLDLSTTFLQSTSVKSWQLKDATVYAEQLLGENIYVNVETRKKKIAELLNAAANKAKLTLIENSALLDEVNFLVESPCVVLGQFPVDYLRLPDGVILSEMNQHQRYFGLRDPSGKLSNHFLIVANSRSASSNFEKNVRSGNERVLNARLADGAFFFDEDLKKPLTDFVADLKQIVFHEGLGTYVEKTQRMTAFAKIFAQNNADATTLDKAVPLAKADLTTRLVYEFDHLQGEIGAIYAARAGLTPDICEAIHQHYQPRYQGDALPSSRLGALISLADKWDNILAAFALGKEPTSSQDPFAVRRQSLYLIQILVAQKINLSLTTLIGESLKLFPKHDAALADKILQFLKVRLVTIFENEGFSKKLGRAAIFSGGDDVYDLFARASALRGISEKNPTEFDALLTAFKRMANIVGSEVATAVDASKFTERAENDLYEFAAALEKRAESITTDPTEHYTTVFARFAAGKNIVDAFFEHVMVNHEDPVIRTNRLSLLSFALEAVKKLIALGELA